MGLEDRDYMASDNRRDSHPEICPKGHWIGVADCSSCNDNCAKRKSSFKTSPNPQKPSSKSNNANANKEPMREATNLFWDHESWQKKLNISNGETLSDNLNDVGGNIKKNSYEKKRTGDATDHLDPFDDNQAEPAWAKTNEPIKNRPNEPPPEVVTPRKVNKNNRPMPNWIRALILIGALVLVGFGVKLIVPFLTNTSNVDTPVTTNTQLAINASTATTTTTTQLTATTTGTNVKFTANVTNKGSIGTYLIDRKGMTLYWTPSNSPSDWPVFFTSDIVIPGSLSLSDFSNMKRADGTYQTTYKGWPLYYCVNDKVPGDTNGQGLGGVWFAVNPAALAPSSSLTSIPKIPTSTFTTIPTNVAITTLTTTSTKTITTITTNTQTLDKAINAKTGIYNNFFLGVVNSSSGVIGGDGCYDDSGNFIILINNKNATDPTYTQLVNFLQNNRTDQYPYIATTRVFSSYYNTAESHVDLARIQGIIDGNIQPKNPDVCADFAERLHNDSEKAGIRCAYVSIELSDYTGGHALDAFQTTDRGLVYVDVTGINGPGPSRCVKTVNVLVGHDYIPASLFPETGWSSTWDNMGAVTHVEIFWDGRWNN